MEWDWAMHCQKMHWVIKSCTLTETKALICCDNRHPEKTSRAKNMKRSSNSLQSWKIKLRVHRKCFSYCFYLSGKFSRPAHILLVVILQLLNKYQDLTGHRLYWSQTGELIMRLMKVPPSALSSLSKQNWVVQAKWCHMQGITPGANNICCSLNESCQAVILSFQEMLEKGKRFSAKKILAGLFKD